MNTTDAPEPGSETNPDPLTGEPGSHPIGTGMGALGGGMAGAALGAMAGPIGAAVGAVVGAVAGGFTGKDLGEGINPTREEAYWRENYHREPYYDRAMEYEDYLPAFRLGWEGPGTYVGRAFPEVEPDFERSWRTGRGGSRLDWNKARHAVEAGWTHVFQPEVEPQTLQQAQAIRPMEKCHTCGNTYDKAFQITASGETYTFDSFECAIQALAPVCSHCQCRIIGHGVEAQGQIFCCAHCAKHAGVSELRDRA